MTYILYLLLAIVVLLFMVLVHEFGHYIIGRLLNFKITEFSVGFGKALFSRKNKRGELISLRIFPLGGYCAFAGEEETSKDNKEAFTNQAPWKRILVFLAGVTFNFATAVIFSFILLCTLGYDIPQVKKIIEVQDFETKYKLTNVIDVYSPYLETDEQLQTGDIIISIDGEKIDFAYGENYNVLISKRAEQLNGDVYCLVKNSSELLVDFDEDKSKKQPLTTEEFDQLATMNAVVKRNGEYQNIKLMFYRIEIGLTDEEGQLIEGESKYVYVWNTTVKAYVHSFTEALKRAVPFAFGLSFTVLKSFWQLITFQLPLSAIGGPITTISTMATVTKASISNLLLLIPLISANLAVFNILPIPALDGAHVIFTVIEAIRKKPIKRKTENLIHNIGLIILFGAVILIDILHFIL